MRYGLDIPAKRILTFAAPTELTPGATKIDRRGTAIAHRVLMRMPHMCGNLRGQIERHGAGAPEIVNYYGAEMPKDSYHARNIEGLPTVSLRPLADCDSHAIMGRLKQEARYAEIMREFLRDSDG